MMEKIVIGGKEYLAYQIKNEESLDRVGINMLDNNSISGLMPFKYVREEDRDYFRFDLLSHESLENWLFQIRYKDEVIGIINSVITVYEEAPAYLLRCDQIFQDLSMISVLNGKCFFAYVPVNDVSYGNCLNLIRQILFRVRYPMDEDFSYLFDLQNAFSREEIKTVADMKKWIRIVNGELIDPASDQYTEEQKQISEPPIHQQVNEIPVKKVEEVVQSSEKSGKKEAVNDIFAEFGIPVPASTAVNKPAADKKKSEKEKKDGFKLFGKKSKPENPVEMAAAVNERKDVQIPQNKVVINDLNRGNVTVLVNNEGPSGAPVLIRDKNRQQYPIMMNALVIGSGKDADIIINDNSSISRKHARLFVSNGEYFIEDLGSTNGTCVNGEVLIPNAPCLISDMAHIKLSNETFTFSMRS